MRPMLARRSLLRSAVLCPLCAPLTAPLGAALGTTLGASAARASEGAHWGYEGADGPDHWAALSPEYRACRAGTEQTPIDLAAGIPAQTGRIGFAYHPQPLQVVNNGHTIQVNVAPGSLMVIGETGYELLQFHFHHPAEHLLAGKAAAMECHFVHRSPAGALAVAGVFLEPGRVNAALVPIWKAMPAAAGPVQAVAGVTVDPAALLPRDRTYFRYMGSLTTPPCSEGVLWTVFRDPVALSPEQVRAFATLFPMNARPAQPLGRRFLLESGV